MTRLLGFTLAATCVFYSFSPIEVNAKSKKHQPPTEISYTVEFVDGFLSLEGINKHREIAARDDDFLANSVLIDNDGIVSQWTCPAPFPVGSTPTAINNRGDVVGICFISAGLEWGYIRNKNGTFTSINALPNLGGATFPYGVNDSGQVVGWMLQFRRSPLLSSAFLYSEGTFTDIILPSHPDDSAIPNPFVQVAAFGINNKGQIVGNYRTVNGVNPFEHGSSRAFLYDKGTISTLDASSASAINNDGQIILAGEDGFFLYDDDHSFRILAPQGYVWRAINGINDKGQLVGSLVKDGEQAARWVIATPIHAKH
jgi:probable HAF family extracellular repeat protein